MRFTTYLISATTLNSSRGNYMSYLLLDTRFLRLIAWLLLKQLPKTETHTVYPYPNQANGKTVVPQNYIYL